MVRLCFLCFGLSLLSSKSTFIVWLEKTHSKSQLKTPPIGCHLSYIPPLKTTLLYFLRFTFAFAYSKCGTNPFFFLKSLVFSNSSNFAICYQSFIFENNRWYLLNRGRWRYVTSPFFSLNHLSHLFAYLWKRVINLLHNFVFHISPNFAPCSVLHDKYESAN